MKKVGILYGGPSSEHEVSINSARNVLNNIDRTLFDPLEIFISRDGVFKIQNKDFGTQDAVQELKSMCDIVFPVLHGSFGEDGTLQELLEKIGLPFIGSGSKASRIAIDKNVSNELFAAQGLLIPRSQIMTTAQDDIMLNFPIIVKPINEGSSVNVYKCDSHEELSTAKEKVFPLYSEMLVQEFIVGREFTCGVLEIKGSPTALPATEIILTNSDLFDYKTKYTPGECREITPADISKEVAEEIASIALQCHLALGCKSLSRTDMILSNSGAIYVLEINTLPGMTTTSFIPAEAQAFGLNMTQLITHLIESANLH